MTETETINRRIDYMGRYWPNQAGLRKKLATGAEPTRADLILYGYRPNVVSDHLARIDLYLTQCQDWVVRDDFADKQALSRLIYVKCCDPYARSTPPEETDVLRDRLFKKIIELSADRAETAEWLPMQERWQHILDHDDAYDPKAKVTGITRKQFDDIVRRVAAIEAVLER